MTPHSSATIEVLHVRACIHSCASGLWLQKKCTIFRCDALISSNYLTVALQLECRKWPVLLVWIKVHLVMWNINTRGRQFSIVQSKLILVLSLKWKQSRRILLQNLVVFLFCKCNSRWGKVRTEPMTPRCAPPPLPSPPVPPSLCPLVPVIRSGAVRCGLALFASRTDRSELTAE